ncbi:MAG: hypothetical protein JNG88_01595 [Phycisphaerales bacterium]|nr:hypothetical protein [Phycisphaerales bacterium]
MICAASAAFFAGVAARAQAPARYVFETGDWLVYERREVSSHGPGGERNGPAITDQIQIWVLSRSGDSSLILLDRIRLVEKDARPARGVVANVDARGLLSIAPEYQPHVTELSEAFELFPILRPATEASTNWTAEADIFGERYAYEERGADAANPDLLLLDCSHASAPGMRADSFSGAIWLDTRTGRLSRRETNITSHDGESRRTITLRLRHAVRNELRWTQQRLSESVRFALALQQQDAQLAEVTTGRVDWETVRPRLTRLWEGCVADIPREAKSPFRVLAGAAREWLDRDAAMHARRGAYAREALNKKPAPWTLLDPSGQPVRSDDLADRWRIEFIWRERDALSRSALHGLNALPVAGASRWSDPPFRVVSLNVDPMFLPSREFISASPAISHHLLAEPLARVDALPELPLIRLVDREGVVKAIWFGWHPWRGAEILRAIP